MTPSEIARKVAEYLQGTCSSVAVALETLGYDDELSLDDEFCAVLDDLVFECTTCNWWYEQSEMADDDERQCEECAGD